MIKLLQLFKKYGWLEFHAPRAVIRNIDEAIEGANAEVFKVVHKIRV